MLGFGIRAMRCCDVGELSEKRNFEAFKVQDEQHDRRQLGAGNSRRAVVEEGAIDAIVAPNTDVSNSRRDCKRWLTKR